MPSDKRDWLHACNSQKVPLEDFKATFCDRCFQVDCTRSLAGSSRFEERVASWKERLFTQVPRMDAQDPRYSQLRAKKFLEINTGPIPEVGGSWVDPRDLDETPKISQAQESQALEKTLPAQELEVPNPPEPRPSLMNTTFQQGQMLGKRQPPAAVPVKDAWEVPVKKSSEPGSGSKVVQPGARIKLGG